MFNNNLNYVSTNGRPITSTQWTNEFKFSFESVRNRFNSLSINSSDGESVVGNSPNVSPLGSTLIRSNSFNKHLDINLMTSEELRLENERIDSKSDFNKNGIEVPLRNNFQIDCIYSLDNNNFNSYEMFGKNNFTYANAMSSAVSSLPSRVPNIATKQKLRRRQKTQMFCAFCKNNNETPEMYSSHILKDIDGRTVCPVLRKYDCPVCRSGGGDNAHTIRYCPKNKLGQIPSVIKILKNSRSADGKKRNK